jgi:aminoglycoside phosphotransferase family enzyme/predicted kinase
MSSDPQADLLRFLADPASYAEQPASVERIDTHSASVFLAGARAYKVKRAVRYSFLDFSTLERRRSACEAELRLNRRTAPRVYLGVEPVTRSSATGQLMIGGNGTPVEWLVVMARFPQEQLLDRLAPAGAISSHLAVQLADRIADFHAEAARTPHRGGADDLRAVVDDNTRAFDAARPHLDEATARAVTGACEAAVDTWRDTLDRRRAGGFVRQCHGDLHLRNIVLIDGQPTLFDAIEFNDHFACIDVWYDLAFLLMDLLARGLTGPANVVLNQYLFRTGDLGGLPLLPLFLACRAAVRAKTSLASAALETDAARTRDYVTRAREYLALASSVLVPVPQRLLAIGGLSGSGKSTLAAAVAPHIGQPPGAIVLRSDVLRKALFHVAPDQRLGADGYTAEATREVYRALMTRAADLLAAGGSVVADATFLAAEARVQVAHVAAAATVPFTGIWLEAPAATLTERLRERRSDVSDATVQVLERQRAGDAGHVTWVRLDASAAIDETAARVQAEIRRRPTPDQ